ncbi:hypothetical protein LguiA_026864 [Lonicera macranthoides]
MEEKEVICRRLMMDRIFQRESERTQFFQRERNNEESDDSDNSLELGRRPPPPTAAPCGTARGHPPPTLPKKLPNLLRCRANDDKVSEGIRGGVTGKKVIMKVYINCVQGTMTTSSSRKNVGEQSFPSKRKRNNRQSSGKKRKPKSVKKAVKKGKMVNKSYGKESSRPTVFKCNLVSVVEEIARMKSRGDIRQCHIGAMMRTPFGGIFKAIF